MGHNYVLLRPDHGRLPEADPHDRQSGPADLTALWRLFDGKWQPFYEHKLAE